MDEIASQIAEKVLEKLAAEEELPGYMALRPKSMTEGLGGSMATGALSGAGPGVLAGAFNPRMAKAIPNDKLRMLAGLLGGAGLGAGVGAGVNTLANTLMDTASRAEEQKLTERGQLTPEQTQQHREMFARQGQ